MRELRSQVPALCMGVWLSCYLVGVVTIDIFATQQELIIKVYVLVGYIGFSIVLIL